MNIDDLLSNVQGQSCSTKELTDLQKAGLQRLERERYEFTRQWIIALYDMGFSFQQIYENTPGDVHNHHIGDILINHLRSVPL